MAQARKIRKLKVWRERTEWQTSGLAPLLGLGNRDAVVDRPLVPR